MNYELENLERYDRGLEQMRVLHIVRDGRDVALSWMNQWFGPKTIAEAAYLWRKHVKHYRKWGEDHPNRYLEVKYEDFLSNPEKALAQIGEFFHLEPKLAGDGVPRLQESLGDEVWARNLAKPLISDNKGKWRHKMSGPDVLLFEEIAGNELALFGYERIHLIVSGSESLCCRLRFSLGLFRRVTDPNFFKRRIRRHLPLGLLLLRRLMPPVATLIINQVVPRGHQRREYNE